MTKCFEGCACMRCKTDVTPEMQNVGGVAANEVCLQLFLAKWNSSVAEQIACAAYRAMHATAPVPLVSEAEDRVAALAAELDEARADAKDLRILAERENKRIVALVAERDLLNAAMHDLLAQRPAPVPDTPKPVADFTRDFTGDRRRMGP